MVTEPAVAEEVEEETISVAKADYEATMTRLHNAEGYTTRQVKIAEEKVRQEYEDKIKNSSTGDKDLDAVRRESLTRLDKAQEKEKEVNLRSLHITAAELAHRYKIDQAELAGFDNEADIRVKAMTLYTERLEAERATPRTRIDTGKGGGISTSWEQIRDAYLADPNNLSVRENYLRARRERGI